MYGVCWGEFLDIDEFLGIEKESCSATPEGSVPGSRRNGDIPLAGVMCWGGWLP
jgi:hypothetical protein